MPVVQVGVQLDRAYPEFSRLGAEIERVIHLVAPVVEEVTALALPELISLRVMTPRGWQARHAERRRQQKRVDKELGPSVSKRAGFLVLSALLRLAERRLWRLIGIQALADPTDPTRSEILVMPAAVESRGLLREEEWMVHEVSKHLTYMAQLWSGAEGNPALRDYAHPSLHGVDGRAQAWLNTGHCEWAANKVTEAILGRTVAARPTDGHPSPEYLKNLKTRERMENSRGWSDEGVGATTARIIAEVGLSAYNRVWFDAALMPTAQETRNPDAWAARLRLETHDHRPS